ncbi:MAG: aspartate/glutamate racemase family protein [Rhodobacteraceae bacterium]|nr:aspartate/glutamate racemase family protein [Paracoccaceae bacterium]
MSGSGSVSCAVEQAALTVEFAPEPRRLGLILLATDMTTEGDIVRAIPPDAAAVHGTRIAYANPTTPENLRAMLPRLSEAAALLVPGRTLAAICYGCTSASVVIGEEAVQTAIGAVRPGIPVVTPAAAGARALRDLGARRIAIMTPYLPETTSPVADFFAAAGFEILRAVCLGLEDDREMARVDAVTILAAAEAADHPEADALFISCTALPAFALAGQIEARIGKPVVTSNQACIRELRAAAGLATPLAGYGRLLAGTRVTA